MASRVSGPRARRGAPAGSTAIAPGSAKVQQLLGLVLGRNLTAERLRKPDGHLTKRRVRGCVDALRDVGDVLEAGANPGRSLEQAQGQHPLVVATDAGDGPEGALGQRPKHRV